MWNYNPTILTLPLMILTALLLAVGAYSDFKKYRVPYWCSASALILGAIQIAAQIATGNNRVAVLTVVIAAIVTCATTAYSAFVGRGPGGADIWWTAALMLIMGLELAVCAYGVAITMALITLAMVRAPREAKRKMKVPMLPFFFMGYAVVSVLTVAGVTIL